jgi:hypothetical protein
MDAKLHGFTVSHSGQHAFDTKVTIRSNPTNIAILKFHLNSSSLKKITFSLFLFNQLIRSYRKSFTPLCLWTYT